MKRKRISHMLKFNSQMILDCRAKSKIWYKNSWLKTRIRGLVISEGPKKSCFILGLVKLIELSFNPNNSVSHLRLIYINSTLIQTKLVWVKKDLRVKSKMNTYWSMKEKARKQKLKGNNHNQSYQSVKNQRHLIARSTCTTAKKAQKKMLVTNLSPIWRM